MFIPDPEAAPLSRLSPARGAIPRRAFSPVSLLGLLLSGVALAGPHAAAQAPSAESGVTWSRDIAPLFQRHCQTCHRPGQIAPMSLLTWEDVRPRARSVARAVADRSMPPWHADPSVGRWKNDPSLSEAEIALVTAWVEAGAPRGDPADLPPPLEFASDWTIGGADGAAAGGPDIVLQPDEPTVLPPDFDDGLIYTTLRAELDRDFWVRAVELLPGNPLVVHHAIVYIVPAGLFGMMERGGEDAAAARAALDFAPDMLITWAPGSGVRRCEPGEGIYIPAGMDIILEIHYFKQSPGEATDLTRVAFELLPGPADKVVERLRVDNETFRIPPGHPAWRVEARGVFEENVEIRSILVHMHLRGRDMDVWLEPPGGGRVPLLRVPDYDFNWQHDYRLAEPLAVAKGTVVRAVAHFDNSAGNPDNPDPSATVGIGYRSDDEMMHAYLSYTVEGGISARQHVIIGDSQARMGLDGEAAARYRLALERNPDYALAHNNLANLIENSGDFEGAIGHLRAALKAAPDMVEARTNLAGCLALTGQTEAAMREYRAVLAGNPKMPGVRFNLGNLHLRAGDFKAAVREYEAERRNAAALTAGAEMLAAARFPREDLAFNFGLALFMDGQFARAAAEMRRAAAENPSDPDVWNLLGKTVASTGDLEAALGHFEKAAALDPAHDEAAANASRVRRMLGRAP